MTFYQGALRKLRMTNRIANVSYKVIGKRIEPQILYVVTSKMSKIFSSTAGKGFGKNNKRSPLWATFIRLNELGRVSK